MYEYMYNLVYAILGIIWYETFFNTSIKIQQDNKDMKSDLKCYFPINMLWSENKAIQLMHMFSL